MILSGDIGGTKTNLGLFGLEQNKLISLHQSSFPSRNYAGLENIVTEFLAQIRLSGKSSEIEAACFGVAGPVVNQECIATNLPWIVSARNLAKSVGLRKVMLLNDLEITAHGIGDLGSDELISLNEGVQVNANAGLIAAGTGLGVACLFWNGDRLIPSASEGGHVEFGPRNPFEMRLLEYLFSQYEHVSIERIVSGPGFQTLYNFLKSVNYSDALPAIEARFAEDDPSSVISQAGLNNECPLCVKTLDMFASIYGACAGNLALTVKSLGGIYIGGGIAPKIISKLKDGTFMGAFLDKGRFTSLLASIPVKVIMNDKTALLGAARVAADSLQ